MLIMIHRKEWFKRVEEYEISKKQKPSFTKTLFHTFGSQLLFPEFLLLVENVCSSIIYISIFFIPTKDHRFNYKLYTDLPFYILHRIWQPLCLNQLISYFDLDNRVIITKEFAYLYATGLIAGSAFIALIHFFVFLSFQTQRIGMKARVASCFLIYRKVNTLPVYLNFSLLKN